MDDAALTPNARADLYIAFGVINKYEELKKHKADPDASQVLAAIDPQPFADEANAAANDIGKDWAERFRKHPRTYSGLSLGKLSSNSARKFTAGTRRSMVSNLNRLTRLTSKNTSSFPSQKADFWRGGFHQLMKYSNL